jgi:NitT/TauT family transport system permease protein
MSAVATLPTRRRANPKIVRGLTGVVVLLALAEAISRLGIVPAHILPPMSRVLADTATLLVDPVFLGDIGATLTAWGIGLGIATVVAVPLGLVLGSFRIAYEASSAVVEFMRPIPSVALIPLAILVFGQNTDMKIALVVYASLWPIFFNTVYGVRDVDPIAKETARTFRLSRIGILARVSLPYAAPLAATGVRISAAIALIVTISAELLAGSASGIGAYILRISSGGGDTSLVFAGTIVAGLLGVVVNLVLVAVERKIFAWKMEGVA